MKQGVALAPFTTFKIGGAAQEFIEVASGEELESARGYAARAGSFAVLGGGSNVLVPDEGIRGLVIKVSVPGIVFEEAGAYMRVIAGAGVSWDGLVDGCAQRGLWGVQNLAGIPGTVGGATVQNIGAYGAELADIFDYADAFDLRSGKSSRLSAKDVQFAYRDSIFKRERALVIMRAALLLYKESAPNLSYKDLRDADERGVPLTSPVEIGAAVRTIRSQKFPDIAKEGTAGSFFKNPVVSRARADALAQQFPGLPQFLQAGDTVKISLAWVLDHVLHVKGLLMGNVRLFERQPLVIVASLGARAADVDALAQEVERKVLAATGIQIEREVENLSARELSTHRL